MTHEFSIDPTFGPLATPDDARLWSMHQEALRAMCVDASSRILYKPLDTQPAPLLDTLYDDCSGSDGRFSKELTNVIAVRSQEPPLPLVSVQGRSEAIVGIMETAYPRRVPEFEDPERIRRSLERPRTDEFSFMVLGGDEEQNVRYVACCLAHMVPSKVRPEQADPVLYVDELAVMPGWRRKLGGIRAFREFLVRAEQYNFTSFELRAVTDSSNKAFLPEDVAMTRVLRNGGWQSLNYGLAASYGEGSQTVDLNLVELHKIPKPDSVE